MIKNALSMWIIKINCIFFVFLIQMQILMKKYFQGQWRSFKSLTFRPSEQIFKLV